MSEWRSVTEDPPDAVGEYDYRYEGGKVFTAYWDGWQFRAEKPKGMGQLWETRPLIVDATDTWRVPRC